MATSTSATTTTTIIHSSSRKVAAGRILFVALTVCLLVVVVKTNNNNNNNNNGVVSNPREQQRQRQQLGGGILSTPQVTLVNASPLQATKAIGSISMPNGSPWCPNNAPAVWVVGHDPYDAPYCLTQQQQQQQQNTTTTNTWMRSTTIRLDLNDALNAQDGNNTNIDRHDCVLMDVNHDGRQDVICTIGANKGKGEGYNELYLTEQDGSLRKILEGHGLAKYPKMRTRKAVALVGPGGNGEERNLVWIGVEKNQPFQGENDPTNNHYMFRNDFQTEDVKPYFNEVVGSWSAVQHRVYCAEAGDITGNGLDDLVVCYEDARPEIYLQATDGTWSTLALPQNNLLLGMGWTAVRLRDVTNDGVLDLVVVANRPNGAASWLFVFRGVNSQSRFDFDTPYFRVQLPFHAPDVEVMDANGDGIKDIYVMQTELVGYCKPTGEGSPIPDDWVPPMDNAPDLLFVGRNTIQPKKYRKVQLDLNVRGCPGMVRRFGDDGQTLLLVVANFNKGGFHAIVEW